MGSALVRWSGWVEEPAARTVPTCWIGLPADAWKWIRAPIVAAKSKHLPVVLIPASLAPAAIQAMGIRTAPIRAMAIPMPATQAMAMPMPEIQTGVPKVRTVMALTRARVERGSRTPSRATGEGLAPTAG